MKGFRTLTAIAALACAGLAYAAVTFDPESGAGFVGKGDVQSPCGWNNAQMQANHLDIAFYYEESEAVEQDCVTGTGRERTVVGVRTRTTSITSEIAADSRRKGQWVGWNLLDKGEETDTSTNWHGDGTGTGCPLIDGESSVPNGAPRVVGEAVAGLFAVDQIPNPLTCGPISIWP